MRLATTMGFRSYADADRRILAVNGVVDGLSGVHHGHVHSFHAEYGSPCARYRCLLPEDDRVRHGECRLRTASSSLRDASGSRLSRSEAPLLLRSAPKVVDGTVW